MLYKKFIKILIKKYKVIYNIVYIYIMLNFLKNLLFGENIQNYSRKIQYIKDDKNIIGLINIKNFEN